MDNRPMVKITASWGNYDAFSTIRMRSSKNKPGLTDVIISEFGFEMTWNLIQYRGLCILNPDSINQIGFIHTC